MGTINIEKKFDSARIAGMNFWQRVRDLRDSLNISQQAMADALELSLRAYTNRELGRLKRGVSDEEREKIAEILDTTVEYLVTGRGFTGGDKETQTAAQNKLLPYQPRKKVRQVVGFDMSAGFDIVFGDAGHEPGRGEYPPIEVESNDPNALYFVLSGDSMEPRFQPGDRIIVEPSTRPADGDFCIYKLKENSKNWRAPRGFKQVFFEKSGMVRFHPLNKIYPDLKVHISEVADMCKVIERRERL